MYRHYSLIKYFALSFAVICPMLLGAQTAAAPTFTTINLNNTVLQSGAKRLGMNLGGINFYDSGQMMKNLIVTNPGFEGEISQSMILCQGGTATSCIDSISYSGWPADYWTGATYTVVYGTAIGRTGTISSFTPANNQTPNNIPAVFNFADSGVAPSYGDYMIVKKAQPGNAADGWNPTTGQNGKITTDTTDLPPDTLGTQAVTLTAPASGDVASLYYYFDSTAGKSFLQLNGHYTLSFKAKTLNPSGTGLLYVALKRDSNGGPLYVYDTPTLTNQWKTYTYSFTASETGIVGTAELDFSTSAYMSATVANSVELDDASLVQTDSDPSNTTVFRDQVVKTLQQLNPGVLRFWFNQEGETLDNLLAPQLARQRSAYSAFAPDVDHISYGLAEFLQLCQAVNAGSSSPIEPWIVLPITLSDEEASNIIDYLADVSGSTVYGAKRGTSQAAWTTVFPKIHLEFGNEAWNNLFYGGNMAIPQAYGSRAQTVFGIMRGNSNFKAANFDLMINGQAYNPGENASIQTYCNNNDTFAAQPYLILAANDPLNGAGGSMLGNAAAIETLFGSTLAEPEAFVTASGTAEGIGSGLVLQNQAAAQASGRPVNFAVTETNISPYGGSITQDELNSYVSSMGAGLAVVDSMLQNMRVGVLTQNIYSLPQFDYFRSDYKPMYLFGSVVDMGNTNLKRPQFLAAEVANNAIGASTNMLQTVHTGLDPTWNQPSVNSVQLNGAHYLQSFAFNNGGNYSLIMLNVNRSASEQVNFGGANVPGGTVQMTQLTSANITDTNETSSVVAPVTSTLSSFNAATGMTLPPFSMTVLTWAAPSITNVTVTAISDTSATVSWTNSDSTSSTSVLYGTTTAYGMQSATIAAGGTQSVTLTGLTAGTAYNFAVMATSGSGAIATSANYTFGTTASFTISAPSSISLAQGQTGVVPVLVTDADGYTGGGVTLSVTGVPTGATGTFTSNAGNASLQISVSSTLGAGTYPLTITGTAGSTVATAPLSLVVSGSGTLKSQTINFTTIPAQQVGATVTPVATASSNLAVTFSVVGNGVCSFSNGSNGSNGIVMFKAPGNCAITASQAGNSTYEPASAAQVVVVGSQTITFTPIPDQTVSSTVSLNATASSGLPVSFKSSTTGVCTVSGSTALMIAKGTCSITASQAGNSSYVAVSAPQSFNVTGQAQTITFDAIAAQNPGASVTLTATASSGLSVTFTSTVPTVCSVVGATATLSSTGGQCTIVASQGGNSSYAAATPVPQTFTVLQNQTITFGAVPAQSVNSTITLNASASSGLAVSFASTTTGVCTVSGTTGSTVTFKTTGACGITASQAGNGSYLGATPVSQTITVLNAQTITFGSIATQQAGTSLTLGATASSGLTVSYAATPSSVCSVSGTTAQFLAGGTCFITASQPGNTTTYAAAMPVTQTITVSGPQNIAFYVASPQTVGTQVTLSATATSGPTVTFASTTPSVCTVTGTTASFIATGSCTITASQAGNSNFMAATASQTVTVNLQTQTITFGAPGAQTTGTSLTLGATASSGLAVSYSTTSAASVCTLSGSSVSFVGAGTCSITASQAGNGTYSAATPVTQNVTVNAAALKSQTITFPAITAQQVGTPLNLNASSNSTQPITFASNTPAVCTVSGATATFVTSGTCSITASQAGNSSYTAAMPVTQSFTVNGQGQIITFNTIATQQIGATVTMGATASSGLAVSYASSTSSVCKLSGSTVTTVAAGTCTITASQTGNSSYAAASPVTQSFNVQAAGGGTTTTTTTASLSSTANVYAIFNNGSTITNGGLANSSYAYSANLLGTNLTYQGILYAFGTAGTANAISSATVSLPAGNYTALNFLGTGLYGNQTAQTFTVTYTDGTTTGFTQSLSDWGTSQSYAGESVASSMAYRLTPTGAQQTGPWNLYAYSFALNSAKTVKSFTLPSNVDVAVLAITLSASQTAQTITFGNIPTQTVGTPLTLSATASSGLAVSYAASPSSVCSISGTTASFAAAGTCTITASQAGNSTYAPASTVSQSFTVQGSGAISSSTTIVSMGSAGNVYGIFANGATVTNGGLDTSNYAYSANLLGTGITVQGIPYSFGTAGTANAMTSGTMALPSGSYSAINFLGTAIYGNQTGQTFTVNYTDGTSSTFTQSMSDWGTPQSYAGETVAATMAYRLSPNGSQQTGASWYLYAYSFALNSGKTVKSFTLPNSRNVTVVAVTLSGAASQTAQTITFGNIAAQTVGTPLALNATASSGLAVSYASSTTSVCTVSGSTVTFVAAGTCTITASQAGNGTYSAATPVSQSFTVNAATLKSQTITFGTIAAQTVGTTLTLTATASSTLAVTYASSTSSICSVSGSMATFLASGTCTITASQGGNSTYSAATPVSQSFTVNGQAQTITFGTIATQTVGTPLTLTATASSGLGVSYASSTTSVCTVSGSTATFVAAGTCTITASQAGSSTYSAAASVTQSFTVQAAQTVVSLTSAANVYGIFANGSSPTNGGLDTSDYAYSSTLLGSSLTVGGIPFTLGSVGAADAVANAKVTLPAGSYSTLYFLGTGIYGNQASQKFTVTYSDGTTTVATQSLSDWGSPQSYTGESTASTMAYRVAPGGGTQSANWYLYKYAIAINSAKTVQSVTLPSNRSVVVLAITLAH
jgi:hypothetical protein